MIFGSIKCHQLDQHWTIFWSFFYIKLITLMTCLQYYKLKPPQPLFSECKNNCFIVHAFLSNKHNQSYSKLPHENRATLNKERYHGWKNLPQISSARTVTICDMNRSNRCFCVSLDMLGEINFWSKLHLKASNLFLWKIAI